MLIARAAGANPASTPIAAIASAAKIAVQKPTWKWAARIPSSVLASSSICRIITAKRIPLIPATIVSTILSEIICERIIFGVAPIARRIPISMVRRTVTIMMFDTPMAPASKVPRPTSQIRKLTPLNRLSSIWKSTSVLNTITPCSSSGSMVWARAIVSRIRSVTVDITTPFLPVTAIMCTFCPML